ncbi:GW dipeptide domain-containing protein [Vagococcus fluvialis]|uniref:GW dipeptide domain-containing protein n=1 Tax=Vagococcus fluvialis TaxID=2738 RepID=UPI003791731E
MKKISVGLLIGMLICPMALASAERTTTNSIHFDEMLTSTSVEDKVLTSESEKLFETATEYTESLEITEKSSEKGSNETSLDEMSKDEVLKYIEELAMKATTPEEYQEVLEYIKKYTDYDQSEKESDIESFSERSYSNQAVKKIGVAEFLGINKAKLLNELQRHEYDNFYLGTPFRGLWTPSAQCLSPNGAPNKYGPGFNCTGFVASVFQRAGGDLSQITRRANAWGDVANAYNWRDALRPNTENYAFNSVNELLSSGKAEKGDVIYFEPDYTKPGYDCHIGFFWGSRSNENLMWHSYDRNIKSNIKSATPFTKIYLFKLGNDKNAVTYDKKMNHKRFIEKNNGDIYPSAYTTGTKRIDTTKDLYHQQVTITREIKNGHGVWQEVNYKKNGKTKIGWVKSNELTDIIEWHGYNDKQVISKNIVDVYDYPYYPSVKTIVKLNNKSTTPVKITQQAVTGYGTWYKSEFNNGGRKQIGWIKSSDLNKVTGEKELNKKLTITNDKGVLYDSPYIGKETNQLGTTKDFSFQSLIFTEEAYTGYGHWYKTNLEVNNHSKDVWIKDVDTSDFFDHEFISEIKYIANNNGKVFDEPYTGYSGKQKGSLKNWENHEAIISEKARTTKGIFYKTELRMWDTTLIGWINEQDIANNIKINNTSQVMTVNTAKGSVYNQPYVGKTTTEIGKTNEIEPKEVTIVKESRTPYGLWYKVEFKGESGWLKSSELSDFRSYQELDTKKIVNVKNGDVYDSPYVKDITKKIGNLSGLYHEPVTINAKATTSFGLWYKTTYYKNRKWNTGWVKSTDLIEKINENKILEKVTVATKSGSLYDHPYIGPKETTEIKKTREFFLKEAVTDTITTTGYGVWYHLSEIDGKTTDFWIKDSDIGLYTDYLQLTTKKFVNKSYGSIYDKPYVKDAKEVGKLTGMKDSIVEIKSSAKTEYGIWYEIEINQKLSGWIKNIDLNDYFKEENIKKTKTIIKENGDLYDTAYLGPNLTKRVGSTEKINQQKVELDQMKTTGYGTWYRIGATESGEFIGTWIKSTDLKD